MDLVGMCFYNRHMPMCFHNRHVPVSVHEYLGALIRIALRPLVRKTLVYNWRVSTVFCNSDNSMNLIIKGIIIRHYDTIVSLMEMAQTANVSLSLCETTGSSSQCRNARQSTWNIICRHSAAEHLSRLLIIVKPYNLLQ